MAAAWCTVRPSLPRDLYYNLIQQEGKCCAGHEHTGMDISLYNQSARLAALEIFVGGQMLLRDTSAVMFEILFPKVEVWVIFSPSAPHNRDDTVRPEYT